MQITIACVGKIKEKYLIMGLAEFQKRLSGYCRLSWIEVPDEKTPEDASAAEENEIRGTEGEKLLKRLPEQAWIIALALNGKQLDSVQLSRRIDTLSVNGHSHLVFVIGGSLGLSDAVLQRADESWSFSALTFPHQLMRLILLEQLYRAFRISRNEPYHK
ncbi:MAG: 23S rRNA (pseudouridine(1915)-N(3))-methyltransferase RlmH [Eubacterium sp.]|nr:23S rRNA (pseudouridine(1915)-N(3))-methyltransferase RlmH [Eubacterium sp.]